MRECGSSITSGAYRSAEDDTYYWRNVHFLFPFYTMVLKGNLGIQKKVQTWVPMDDSCTLYFQMSDLQSSSEQQKTKLPRSADWWEGTKELRERFEADLAAPSITT